MTYDHVVIHTDGGSRGNPGPAAIGAVIEHDSQEIHTISRSIGDTTNNQAEYQALYAALLYALEIKAQSVEVFADSELVVKQLQGTYKMKNKDLGPWFIKVKSLINQIGRVTLTAIPREKNARADALVNQALDQQEMKG